MANSKMCFKCEQIKPLSEFYKHKAMGDGHLGKCKECAKVDVITNRKLNINYYRAYDSERAKLKKRIESRAKVTRRRRKEFPPYQQAHNAVSRAIANGKLTRMPCQMCGSEDHVHAHHDDYYKPLEVMWLCPQHHAARHCFLNNT